VNAAHKLSELEDQIADLRGYIADHTFSLKFCFNESQQQQLQQMITNAQQDLDNLLHRQARLLHPSNTNTEGHTVSDIQETQPPITVIHAAADSTVTVTEAAKLLGVTSQTIRNWVRAGRLTTIQHGKQFRISAVELHALQTAAQQTRVIEAPETRVL
jgi:excisionase family DNA binding protein